MMEIGRLAIKTAGREAGKVCVVVEIIKPPYVIIDGDVRRKKCNINHLEALPMKIDVKKSDSHDKIVEELKKAGYDISEKKKKERKEKAAKPAKKRKVGDHGKKKAKKAAKKAKAKPKAEKKSEKKEEKKPKKAKKK
ncbi:MAG: 50S ribosomal protein L14e [Candidatus Nanoarchaeia archaeon]|nr:50S ribosomal protein L14e [Candidatus Nanoarchaeia archaeon]